MRCARETSGRGAERPPPGSRLKRPIGPFVPFMAMLLLLLLCCFVRLLGMQGTALTAVQLLPTVALIVAIFALLDASASDPVPGANDNASGVATALSLAERFGGKLDHFAVWILDGTNRRDKARLLPLDA